MRDCNEPKPVGTRAMCFITRCRFDCRSSAGLSAAALASGAAPLTARADIDAGIACNPGRVSALLPRRVAARDVQ